MRARPMAATLLAVTWAVMAQAGSLTVTDLENGNFEDSVEWANGVTIASGSVAIGPWVAVPGSPPRQGLAVVRQQKWVYAIAGCTDAACNSMQSDVYYTEIDGGSVGTWSKTGAVGNRAVAAAIAYNGYLYV